MFSSAQFFCTAAHVEWFVWHVSGAGRRCTLWNGRFVSSRRRRSGDDADDDDDSDGAESKRAGETNGDCDDRSSSTSSSPPPIYAKASPRTATNARATPNHRRGAGRLMGFLVSPVVLQRPRRSSGEKKVYVTCAPPGPKGKHVAGKGRKEKKKKEEARKRGQLGMPRCSLITAQRM